MKILIVAATESEIAPLHSIIEGKWSNAGKALFAKGDVTVRFLITGVGMVRTSYALGKALSQHTPDLCINAGIAGAFADKFKIGDVVHVIKDCLPELGATDVDGEHLTMSDMNLAEDISSIDGLVNTEAGTFDFLPKATGITINTVHGEAQGIAKLQERFSEKQDLFSIDIETMESAAFFYCCMKEKVPFIAIRAISNIVEPRDRSKWNIPLAVANLNRELVELIDMFVVKD